MSKIVLLYDCPKCLKICEKIKSCLGFPDIEIVSIRSINDRGNLSRESVQVQILVTCKSRKVLKLLSKDDKPTVLLCYEDKVPEVPPNIRVVTALRVYKDDLERDDMFHALITLLRELLSQISTYRTFIGNQRGV